MKSQRIYPGRDESKAKATKWGKSQQFKEDKVGHWGWSSVTQAEQVGDEAEREMGTKPSTIAQALEGSGGKTLLKDFERVTRSPPTLRCV